MKALMNRTSQICLLPMIQKITSTASLLALASIAAGGSVTSDLRTMSQEQKFSIVMAALQTRDAQLENFSCDFSEECSNVFPTGKREPVKRVVGALARLREHSLLRAKLYMLNRPEAESEFISVWDGTVQRALTWRRKIESAPRGTVRDTEIPALRGLFYTQMLGFRVPEASLTLPEWLTRQKNVDKVPFDVEVETVGPTDLVSLKIESGPNYYDKYWLDAERGFLPLRYDYRITGKAGENTARMEVKEAKAIDGIWIPLHVTRSMRLANSKYETVLEYVVTSFKRGGMHKADFVITFPPGSEVTDQVHRTAYRVTANGDREYESLFDAATGKIVDPATRPSAIHPSSAPN
jgi:hypothetical protein